MAKEKITKEVLISSFGFNKHQETGFINGISEITFVFTKRYNSVEEMEQFKSWIEGDNKLKITIEEVI